jgi:hypothetical protein
MEKGLPASAAHSAAHTAARTAPGAQSLTWAEAFAHTLGRRIVRQRNASLLCALSHLFVMLSSNSFTLLCAFRAPHPVAIRIAFLLGHHLAAVNALLRLRLRRSGKGRNRDRAEQNGTCHAREEKGRVGSFHHIEMVPSEMIWSEPRKAHPSPPEGPRFALLSFTMRQRAR